MKKFLFFAALIYSFSVFSQSVSMQKAQSAALSFLGNNYTVDTVEVYCNESGDTLFYMINMTPDGYAIVSANEQMMPIVGWSKTSAFNASPLFLPIVEDYYMSFSKAVNDNFTAVQKTNIQTRWNQLTGKTRQTPRVECWPAPGSTATEGWVETRWTQTSPYNLMCPMDPENNTRSYAGCPAIVMSQVLNYLRTTHHTRFNDSDDYLHNYGGRVYDIDDDADSLRFPSFPVLNGMLDDADSLYALNEAIGNSLAAALVFASGTACTQVYTSEGSGTFAVNQAYQAYQRFGFGNSILYQTADSGMYANLIDNLKNGYPAHLALVDEAWSTGHNVVVDGYRADGYFHINFGWGGQSDGWWLVPDPAFPYSLGVLEGIVVNIIPDEVGITESASNKSFVIRPNPAEDTIYLSSLQDDNVRYSIFSVNGQQVQKGKTDGIISVSKLCSGTYILNIDTPNGKLSEKFIVVKNH